MCQPGRRCILADGVSRKRTSQPLRAWLYSGLGFQARRADITSAGVEGGYHHRQRMYQPFGFSTAALGPVVFQLAKDAPWDAVRVQESRGYRRALALVG